MDRPTWTISGEKQPARQASPPIAGRRLARPARSAHPASLYRRPATQLPARMATSAPAVEAAKSEAG